MERMTATPMHVAAHELTRARMSLVCAWTNGNVSFAFISKAYGARRLGSTST
jgi:hypothetical protein